MSLFSERYVTGRAVVEKGSLFLYQFFVIHSWCEQ